MATPRFIDHNNDIGGADYLRTERSDPRQVSFTPQQLDALEALYPEFYAINQTDAELRFRAGQRSVLHFIKERVRR